MWYAYAKGSWNPIEPPLRATLFGDGVFETIHIYHHVPLFIEKHIARLAEGLTVLGLIPPLSVEEIAGQVMEIANLHPYARLKVIAYRKGEGTYTPPTSEAGVVMGIFPYAERGSFPLASPVVVGIYPFPVNVSMPWSRFKTLSALRYVQAAAYAKEQGYADVILLSTSGYLSETSRANLFFWDGQTLSTPSLSTGCVEGVFQQAIRQIAREDGIPFQEVLITLDELAPMREIFSTNVMQGIQPITAVLQEGRSLYHAPRDFGLAGYLALRVNRLLGSAMTNQ
ncbi:MAG: aminotransferase class IV [Bacteroidia bacterium]|nr:aminotransferase class IV [Bacteroidia bacterium]